VQHRLGLAAPPLLHIADGGVVLDVQRPDRRKVSFDKLRPQLPDPDRRCGGSKVLLGLDLNRKLCFADLAEPEHTHILVAGTTGSGKSEWLRCALAGLLLTNTPETLRLVLIDPKRNTFAAMRGSRFLLPPFDIIYPDERSTADVFSDLGDEMDERYRRMQAAGCDQRDEFVRRADEPMARIVCICDEYLDLINRGRDERRAVERQVFRLGAKARSAGIHLIIATQQPSRQVIKGALDANLPARVGLKMNRDIESQMLLGCRGAENLLGNGDLLFKDIGDPVRLQAPLLSAQEREAIFGRGRLGA
jgi:DNA segregation ATPase FtsK/SpoIIIE-like protein